MDLIKDVSEALVMKAVETKGSYVGKLNCLLCLPLRQAAARLTERGVLECVGDFDGKRIWREVV
jgi:hypothetical protein